MMILKLFFPLIVFSMVAISGDIKEANPTGAQSSVGTADQAEDLEAFIDGQISEWGPNPREQEKYLCLKNNPAEFQAFQEFLDAHQDFYGALDESYQRAFKDIFLSITVPKNKMGDTADLNGPREKFFFMYVLIFNQLQNVSPPLIKKWGKYTPKAYLTTQLLWPILRSPRSVSSKFLFLNLIQNEFKKISIKHQQDPVILAAALKKAQYKFYALTRPKKHKKYSIKKKA